MMVYSKQLMAVVWATALACSSVASAAKPDASMVLKKEPKGAVDVLALKKDVNDQAEVIVVGRIG
jgi:hypothetical protein